MMQLSMLLKHTHQQKGLRITVVNPTTGYTWDLQQKESNLEVISNCVRASTGTKKMLDPLHFSNTIFFAIICLKHKPYRVSRWFTS